MVLDDIMKIQCDNCPRFSVFAKDKLPLPGDKKHLNEILNREIIITDFRITNSKQQENGKCLQLQFLMDGNVYVAFSGSNVLIDQIQSTKDKIPFKTVLVKIDKYFSFS